MELSENREKGKTEKSCLHVKEPMTHETLQVQRLSSREERPAAQQPVDNPSLFLFSCLLKLNLQPHFPELFLRGQLPSFTSKEGPQWEFTEGNMDSFGVLLISKKPPNNSISTVKGFAHQDQFVVS